MFKLHVFALTVGMALELFIGKVPGGFDPFLYIKKWIKYLDLALLGKDIILIEPERQRRQGVWLLILAIVPFTLGVLFFNLLFWEISPVLGFIWETLLSYLCLSGHNIYYGSHEVLSSYFEGGLEAANSTWEILFDEEINFSDENDMADRSISYIARRTGDVVLGQALVLFAFGPVVGFAYRIIDLADSLVACNDKRYRYFGYYVARLNHYVNFIPSAFAARLCIFTASLPFNDFDKRNAKYIYMRDSIRGENVNALRTLSAFAGALGLSLENGRVGDMDREIGYKDIKNAAYLMRNSYIVFEICLLILLIIC